MTHRACEEIARSMGELFECAEVNEYIRIRTPYLYPDGDVIDLFLQENSDTAVLTDLGETLGWLRMQTVSDRKTIRQRQLIDDVCLTHGVELYKGMLVLRVREHEDFSSAVTRLSQAALRVADVWFTFRGRSLTSINDEIEEFLNTRSISYERNQKVPGRSQRLWNVDFHTRTSDRSSFVNVLSTGSRARARQLAEHTLAVWVDLSHLRLSEEPRRFVSLFDDELDVWSQEDFSLLEDFSYIAYWSQKDELEELLIS